jgi:phosphatidylglycerophosphatase A
VIDEVCGQLITFMFVPVHLTRSLLVVSVLGFLLFRLFDIIKPYPAQRLEELDAGLGAMADDVMAGLYAALVLSFLLPLIAPWLR